MKTITLVSTYNRGFGLWTLICSGCCSIFGLKSKAVFKKSNEMINILKKDIDNQVSACGGINLRDFRIIWTNGFSAIAYATIDVPDQAEGQQKEKASSNSQEEVQIPSHCETEKCGICGNETNEIIYIKTDVNDKEFYLKTCSKCFKKYEGIFVKVSKEEYLNH